MPTPGRILLIFAHPDDETFVAGGITRRYADAGAEVALVTATRGDAGRCGGEPPLCSRDELPAIREGELREAAAILGLAHVHLLDYRDKHLAEARADDIRAQLVGFIRRHRPHVVITFDPAGMNGHTDHVAISRFTMDAIVASADPRVPSNPGRAYRVPRMLWSAPIAPWQVTESGDLAAEAGVDFVIDTTSARHAKAEALRAHRTQQVPIDRCFFSQSDVDEILRIEVFRQAWGTPTISRPADDLLVGLDLDT